MLFFSLGIIIMGLMPTEYGFIIHTDTQSGKTVCIGLFGVNKISGNKLYGLTADRV